VFEDIFSRFYEKNKEIKVIGVWGKDGLVLEKQYFPGGGEPEVDIDVEFSGAELADIISKLDQTRTSKGQYFLKLNYDRYFLMIFSLTGDYFLMLLTGGDILEGKLKFYLSLYKEQLVAAL
jgi:hypothetical protein